MLFLAWDISNCKKWFFYVTQVIPKSYIAQWTISVKYRNNLRQSSPYKLLCFVLVSLLIWCWPPPILLSNDHFTDLQYAAKDLCSCSLFRGRQNRRRIRWEEMRWVCGFESLANLFGCKYLSSKSFVKSIFRTKQQLIFCFIETKLLK